MRRRAKRGIFRCGWCGRHMREAEEVITLAARAAPDIELSGAEGGILTFSIAGRRQPAYAIVSTLDSPAREAGEVLLFTACSVRCAE